MGDGLKAAFDYQDWDNNAAANTDQTKMTFALFKDLSKRTNIYAAFQMENFDSATLKDGETLAIGIPHNF